MASLGEGLPAGWTCHNLAGRTFYYHAATNTTRPDFPSSFQAVQQAETAMYPEPASEPQPPVARHEEQPLPPALQPAMMVACSPAQQLAVPLPPAVEMQPGVYCQPVQVAVAQPMPQPSAPTQQPMVQLQVLVPEPGLRAGQQLAFTAPAAGPGLQPQQMTVTVNQEVVPGSIVTVQYPGPQRALVQPGQRSLPQQTWEVDPAEDRRQSQMLWGLYGSGLLFMCCFMPLSFILWITAGAIYFCKPANQRVQYRQARTPALTATITCLTCCLLAVIGIPIAIAVSHGELHPIFGPGHHHGHHHHGKHDGPDGPDGLDGPDGPDHGPQLLGTGLPFLEARKDPHHHGPCPIKKFFQKWFHHAKKQDHHWGAWDDKHSDQKGQFLDDVMRIVTKEEMQIDDRLKKTADKSDYIVA